MPTQHDTAWHLKCKAVRMTARPMHELCCALFLPAQNTHASILLQALHHQLSKTLCACFIAMRLQHPIMDTKTVNLTSFVKL